MLCSGRIPSSRSSSGPSEGGGSEHGDCWAGILKRVWPNAKYLDAISMTALRYYSGGGIPIVSTVYGSSECYFGLNLQPMSGGDPATLSSCPRTP